LKLLINSLLTTRLYDSKKVFGFGEWNFMNVHQKFISEVRESGLVQQ